MPESERNPNTRVLTFLSGCIRTMRPITSSIVFLSILVTGATGVGIWQHSFVLAIIGMSVAMAGFAINDYSDAEKDAISAPKRAIPTGLISKRGTLYLSLICSAVAISLMTTYCSIVEGLIVVAGIVLVFGYNIVIRITGHLKNPVTGLICVLPLLLGKGLPHLDFGSSILLIACFLFIWGREMLMDVRDVDGDRAFAILTVPVRTGVEFATTLAFSLIASSIPLVMLSFLTIESTLLVICTMGYAFAIFVAYRVWKTVPHDRSAEVLSIQILKIPMLLGVVLIFIDGLSG